MKKHSFLVGLVVCTIAITLSAALMLTATVGIDADDGFPEFIQEALPKLTTWELAQYQQLMSKEGFEVATTEQWQQYLNALTKLGELQSVGNIQFQGFNTSAQNGPTIASYLVPVTFSTGEAHVQLGLQHHDGMTSIKHVRFLSERLAE